MFDPNAIMFQTNVAANDEGPSGRTVYDVEFFGNGTLYGVPPTGSFKFPGIGRNGTWAIFLDGTLRFDPRTDFEYLQPFENETACFRYVLTDNGGAPTATFDSAEACVTVLGENDPPRTAAVASGGAPDGKREKAETLLGLLAELGTQRA